MQKIPGFIIISIILSYSLAAQSPTGSWRTYGVMNTNELGLLVYNFGQFGHPSASPSFEWPRNSHIHYGNRFGLVVGGEVTTNNRTIQIVSHSLDTDLGDANNARNWEPLPDYCVDFNHLTNTSLQPGYLAKRNRPETWGENFPKDSRDQLLWPGQFGAGKALADEEFYYKMDDRLTGYTIDDLPSPFIPDTSQNGKSRMGLGVEVTARGYQFAPRVAENMFFLLFEIKNVGSFELPRLVAGIYGDPQIGGRENNDGDNVAAKTDSNLVYFWDKNSGQASPASPAVGYFGLAFLQTPGVANDGRDNDGDGIVDESPANQIDDDQDWQNTDAAAVLDPSDFDGKSDDVGPDGLPATGDEGEGNAQPDPGEPDYELLDVDETDELGLTSFSAIQIAGLSPKNRRKMWENMKPGIYQTEQGVDLGALMASGYFNLASQNSEQLTLLVALAETAGELHDQIHIADQMLRYNYNFLKSPEIPVLQAEAGNQSIILTWDNRVEQQADPILGNDFEGYAVYRSTDGVNWGKPITNSAGERIYDTPIARFDRADNVTGFHPIDVEGARFYLGDDRGLQYTCIDSPLINGVTYYYALTAYDFGSERYRIPPLECSKISGNPNVVRVTPRSNPGENLDEVYVVPNPYIAGSVYDQPAAGSELGYVSGRRVLFMNLPMPCTIRIYTVTGELVQQLEHVQNGGDAVWDLLNHNGQEISSGTYIYHVEAAVGTKIGRMAVIK